MKIKDDADLANILGMAFASYANKVQNGYTAPFQAFLAGNDSVDVKVSLMVDGSINIAPIVSVVEPIVQVQVPVQVEPPVLEASLVEEVVEEVVEKPKRKRKTQ